MDTITNLHFYVADYLYLVPLTKDAQGLWVEVQPVTKTKSFSINDLSEKISEYAQIANNLISENAWDGDQGLVWKSARDFISARQNVDKSWKLIPFKPKNKASELSSDQIEWIADRSQMVSLKPSLATNFLDVAKALLQMIGNKK